MRTSKRRSTASASRRSPPITAARPSSRQSSVPASSTTRYARSPKYGSRADHPSATYAISKARAYSKKRSSSVAMSVPSARLSRPPSDPMEAPHYVKLVVPVAVLLLRLDGRGSLQRQTYQALRGAILRGRLAPASRLPSTRELAGELGIARNTVLLAYDRLVAEGYATTPPASGTFVVETLPASGHG